MNNYFWRIMRKISIASGGFDPIHVGHLELFEKTKTFSDELWVIVNTDEFLTIKKGKPFMPFAERIKIVEAIKWVNKVIPSIDKNQTVIATLEKIVKNENVQFYFVNGGDRNCSNIPEAKICDKYGIIMIDGLGNKIQSSSRLTI